MKFIKRIEEGEMWTAAFIGWKFMHYTQEIGPRDWTQTWVLRIGLNLWFVLIRFEIVPLIHPKKKEVDIL